MRPRHAKPEVGMSTLFSIYIFHFRRMLELGKSVPWKEALEVLTGSPKLSSKPLLDYFKPLGEWLDKHRESNGYSLGWDEN